MIQKVIHVQNVTWNHPETKMFQTQYVYQS